MGATSEILGNSGSPHQIEHNGKCYAVRLIDDYVQSAFEKRLYEKDCLGVRVQREQGLLDPAQYAARLRELADAFRDGAYELLTPGNMALLGTVPGTRLLLSLLVNCSKNELLVLLLAKRTEITALVNLIIRESFPGVDFSTTDDAAPDATNPPDKEQPVEQSDPNAA